MAAGWVKGKMPKEVREKISLAHKKRGTIPPARRGIPFTLEQRTRLAEIRKARRLIPPMTRPEVIAKAQATKKRTFDRRGRKSRLRDLIKRTPEYKTWRRSVFERDKYTCQMCAVRGGELQADHIRPFAYFPDLRFELSNGRTLCRACHKSTPTYGGRARRAKMQQNAT